MSSDIQGGRLATGETTDEDEGMTTMTGRDRAKLMLIAAGGQASRVIPKSRLARAIIGGAIIGAVAMVWWRKGH